jgi:DNA-directed RNA polymerase subunit RPC12/RpoP
MKIQPYRYACQNCAHEWVGEMLVECSVSLWAKALSELRCPKCGSEKLLLGWPSKPSEQPTPVGEGATLPKLKEPTDG